MGNFKVGDVVVCVNDKDSAYLIKEGQEYVVTKVHSDGCVSVGGLSFGWLASRFELKGQPAEQKTKIIKPVLVEDWYKAVGMYFKGKKVKEFKYVTGRNGAAVCFLDEEGDVYHAGGYNSGIEVEIPITTKRIPFDPERKDAKVFYGEQELLEWVQMKSGVVCGTIKLDNFNDEHTSLYHPNDLKMEIEE